MPENKDKSKLITKELDYFIETTLPQLPQLTFAKEITFKLIPAIAIAFLITYLILFDRHSRNLSATTSLGISMTYFVGMLAFGAYIYANRDKKLMRHLHSMATVGGCIWFLLQSGKVELPADLFLSLVCIANLFVSALAIIFFLIDNAYTILEHIERFSFDNCRHLVIERLIKFDEEEINSAIFNTKAIATQLDRKIDFYKLWGLVIFMPLFCGTYIILFCQAKLPIIWWVNPFVIYGSIITILLSIVIVFIVIDNIRCIRKLEHYRLYRLILLEYDIERLKFTNSLLRTELN